MRLASQNLNLAPIFRRHFLPAAVASLDPDVPTSSSSLHQLRWWMAGWKYHAASWLCYLRGSGIEENWPSGQWTWTPLKISGVIFGPEYWSSFRRWLCIFELDLDSGRTPFTSEFVKYYRPLGLLSRLVNLLNLVGLPTSMVGWKLLKEMMTFSKALTSLRAATFLSSLTCMRTSAS